MDVLLMNLNKKRRIPRWLRNTLIVLLVLTALAAGGIAWAIENYLPYSAIRPYRLKTLELAMLPGKVSSPAHLGLRFDTLNVVMPDVAHGGENILLKGWFVHAQQQPARGTVVLMHGISDCRVSMLPMAELLAQRGFNLVMYDSRANGVSGGIDCTFGYYEKQDVSAVLDEVERRYPTARPFAMYGASLGAAVTVQAVAHDRRLACGVAQSPFATLRETCRDYFERIFLVPNESIPDKALLKSEQIARFKVDDVAPEKSARAIVQPMMIVHGVEDGHISPAYGRRVFDNLGSAHKVWYPLAGAKHHDVFKVGGKVYMDSVAAFIAQNIDS